MDEIITETKQPDVSSFKNICLRLGYLIMAMFILRDIGAAVQNLAGTLMGNALMSQTSIYFATSFISLVFLYFIPVPVFMWIMKFTDKMEIRSLYAKPKRLAKAIGNFPATYGLGYTINLLTLAVMYLIVHNNTFGEAFNPVNQLDIPSFGCGLFLFFEMVVLAPLFEEFMFRGVIMKKLMPYGNGFAILASAFTFGLAHGNFQQFFYTFAVGICFGYIFYATKTLIPSMIMHAMLNSISGIIMLFASVPFIQKAMTNASISSNPDSLTDEQNIIMSAFAMFVVIALIIVFIGFILMIKKLRNIKRYKVEPNWTAVSKSRKLVVFITSFTVIIGIIFAADAFTYKFVAKGILFLISGGSLG